MEQFGCSGSGSGSGSSGDDFEIPVWFSADEKWITGVTKRTTCDDVIYALLCQVGGDCVSDDIGSYAVFERWRGVERPLTGRTKLLKVWRAWGMEGSNNGVRFYVRRLDECSAFDSSCESIRPRRSARRHHHHHYEDRTQSSSSSRHHHRQRDLDSAAKRRENEKTRAFHRLVQLVIEQEKDIQRQLQHIRDTDGQIEHYETKVHVARLAENGLNYVQDAYLRDVSDESATSGDELFPAVKAADIEAYLRICEHIITLEDCLSSEEGKIDNLSRQIEEQSFCEGNDEPGAPTVASEPAEEHFRLEMVKLREELHRCVSLSREQSAQVDHVNRLFVEYDQQMDQRHAILNDLLWQVEMTEAADVQRPLEVSDNLEYNNGLTDETKDLSSGVESGSADSDNKLLDIENNPKTPDTNRSHQQQLQQQHKQCRQSDTYEQPHKPEQRLRRPPSWISPSGDCNGVGAKTAKSTTVSFESPAPDGDSPMTSTPACYTNMVPYCTYNTYGTYDEQTDVVSASKHNASEDTNSDTGLSSMHSDEQITILETLV
ncbi:Ras association domain-containing protein 10 [Lamellibrachia satsuma]|nr:Ras association domain-containing protein 10 [Lamellibrachia satsuma]